MVILILIVSIKINVLYRSPQRRDKFPAGVTCVTIATPPTHRIPLHQRYPQAAAASAYQLSEAQQQARR